MRGMSENTAGPGGGQAPEQHPGTVTDGSSATPPPPTPPPGYTPTEMYQPPTAQQPPTPPRQGGAPYPPTQPYPQAPYGSYGYPQQGGYPAQGGYPQQPAPYPQQVPPQPYPQQGQPYPQAQPPYPQAPYPQPPYPQAGYGAGGYPPPPVPPAPPRRGVRKGAVLGIIGGVLVLAIAGTVLAVANNGSGGGTGGNTLSTVWSVPSSGGDDRLVGSWLTSTAVVRAGTDSGVSAYDLVTGHKTWTVDAPTDASKPCAMSPDLTSDGIGTVGFGTDGNSCKYVVGVDTRDGDILWKVDLTDTDDPVPSSAQTFVQGSVATILSLGRVDGFDTKTGKRIWFDTSRGKYCNADAFGTTGAVVIDDFCADASPERTLTALDPATGKQLWRKTEPEDIVEGYVLNGAPLVALLSPNRKDPVSLYSSSGATTPVDMTHLVLENGNPLSVKLSDQTLVVQSAQDTSDTSSTAGQVIAYDLTTGHQLWRYNGESGHGAVLVRTASGGKLYALSTGAFGGSPHFVQLDPATGTSTILGALPSDSDNWLIGDSVLYTLPNGGLLTLGLGYQTASAPSIGLYDK